MLGVWNLRKQGGFYLLGCFLPVLKLRGKACRDQPGFQFIAPYLFKIERIMTMLVTAIDSVRLGRYGYSGDGAPGYGEEAFCPEASDVALEYLI